MADGSYSCALQCLPLVPDLVDHREQFVRICAGDPHFLGERLEPWVLVYLRLHVVSVLVAI